MVRSRRSASSAASPSAASPSSPSIWPSRRRGNALPAPLPVPGPAAFCSIAAEDALHIVRRRLEGICAAAGSRCAELDVQVITAPTLRLDLVRPRLASSETVARLKPRLLVLDPFVRLHRIDENASGEVAPLLAFLRELQRRHALAVVVVHHARKGAGDMRAGQALADPPSSTPGATPISTCAATATNLSSERRAPRRFAMPATPSNAPSAMTSSPCRPSRPMPNPNVLSSKLPSISASLQRSPTQANPSHSPSYVLPAAFVQLPSTNASPP